MLSPASIPLPQYLAKAPQLPGKPQSCVTEIHIINSTITMAGHDINQTINNISLDAHFDEKLIDRKFQAKQAEFLKKKNHSLTTLKELPGGESSLIKIFTILRSVCLVETPTGCLGTGFLVKIPAEVLALDGKDRLAFMSAGHSGERYPI